MGPSPSRKGRGLVACTIIALLASAPSFAVDEAVDERALAIAKEKARAQLEPELQDLSPPLSQAQIERSGGWISYTFEYLVDGHPGREEDAVTFINDVFVPVMLETREDLLCRKTRAIYARLLRAVDGYVEAKQEPAVTRAVVLSDSQYSWVTSMVTMGGIFRYDWYYLLLQTWYDLHAADFNPYFIEVGKPVDTTHVFRREALEEALEERYALSTPCGAPWVDVADH